MYNFGPLYGKKIFTSKYNFFQFILLVFYIFIFCIFYSVKWKQVGKERSNKNIFIKKTCTIFQIYPFTKILN